MLEKPPISDPTIADCLQESYNLSAVHITFLPLGADMNTAVYRINTSDQDYFLKLRSGPFNPASVILPHLLREQGIGPIIAPLPTTHGQLYSTLGNYTVNLTPYIEGRNAYRVSLSDQEWVEFGALLKRFHTTSFPPALTDTIPREGYSPQWRDMVREYLAAIENESFTDPIAAELAAFLKTKRRPTLDLLTHAERQLQILQSQPPPSILCHADIHAGNIHITAENTFYLIDWDTLILAPKERDLMSIGAGLMGSWRTPQEEERLFYQGYGSTNINQHALRYYRSARIIEDIALYCRQIFSRLGIPEDRQEGLYYLKSNYDAGGTIELARRE